MYSLKKMTQKISKTYTLSFPKAAHSLEAQDQGDLEIPEERAVSHFCDVYCILNIRVDVI